MPEQCIFKTYCWGWSLKIKTKKVDWGWGQRLFSGTVTGNVFPQISNSIEGLLTLVTFLYPSSTYLLRMLNMLLMLLRLILEREDWGWGRRQRLCIGTEIENVFPQISNRIWELFTSVTNQLWNMLLMLLRLILKREDWGWGRRQRLCIGTEIENVFPQIPTEF